MERVEGSQKGTIVLATVKGDVHDIGKNLVDIILTNNGYRVVNLGIKQPLANILAAAAEHRANAIGMSGLLVKSTVVMRENMLEMTRQGLNVPVMLGGAALTRQYVEEDCVRAYGAGRVAYARDAFDGLRLMDRIMSGCFDTYLAERQEQQKARPRRQKPARTLAAVDGVAPDLRPLEVEATRLRRNELSRGIEVPKAPFFGPRVVEEVPVRALLPYLNENMLYQFHWGFKKDGRTLPRIPRLGRKGAAPDPARADPGDRGRARAPAAGGLRLLAGGRLRQRPDPVRPGGSRARGRPLQPAPPGQAERPLHRRFPA